MNGSGLSDETVETLSGILDDHGVSFAMLFGSGARDTMDETSDLDLVIEFGDTRPTDEGYSDHYLELLAALDEALPVEVDVVDVHTLTPQFASVAFDEGVVLLGTETRKERLTARYGGDPPTVSDARSRVSAAVERLQDRTTG